MTRVLRFPLFPKIFKDFHRRANDRVFIGQRKQYRSYNKKEEKRMKKIYFFGHSSFTTLSGWKFKVVSKFTSVFLFSPQNLGKLGKVSWVWRIFLRRLSRDKNVNRDDVFLVLFCLFISLLVRPCSADQRKF